MTNPKSDRILQLCRSLFAANSDDCNKYVKAVSHQLFPTPPFAASANADSIMSFLVNNSEWTRLGTSHKKAIQSAQDGLFVVAGMTSVQLSAAHGHLAVVVGDDGQVSGTTLVPICYAGSLAATARVERKRISETFGTAHARESKISYFSRLVTT